MTVDTFNFTDGVSGKIARNDFVEPPSYTASTGWESCQIAQSAFSKTNAFFQFDTSSIPDNAIITKVEFLVRTAITQPPTAPSAIEFFIGSWVGATLDGSAADFDGGNFMYLHTGALLDNTWYDLNEEGRNPMQYVNVTGTTDVKITDETTGGSTGQNYNTSKAKCQLRVTYTVPSFISRLSLLGVG